MSKQPTKEKKSKAKFGRDINRLSRNKNIKGKSIHLEEDKKKKPQINLLPSKNVNDIIDKIVKEGPKKLKRSNVSEISKMILGNLENVLGKAKKANIENLTRKSFEKKLRSHKNENNSDSEVMTMTFSKKSGDNSARRVDMEKNPPPLRKLLIGKTEEEKNLISSKIKDMLNTPHEIKFVDEDAKKVYKKKVVKKLRGLSPMNKTVYLTKSQKAAKAQEEKPKEKKKPVTEEQLLKRFVKNGMTLPNDKSERKRIISCLWQTKRSLWKKRAQLIKQIEESSRADFKPKEQKDHGDQPSDAASVVKTYVVPDTVKGAKKKNLSLVDSVVYIEEKQRGKSENVQSTASQENYPETSDKQVKTERHHGQPDKKVLPKVMTWNTKPPNKEQQPKVAVSNESKQEKTEANKMHHRMKNRYTLLPNRNQQPKKTEAVVPEVREHELLGREQLGVPEKAYKQIIQDVANFIKKEEKKIVQNLCEKYKEESKQSPEEVGNRENAKSDERSDLSEKKTQNDNQSSEQGFEVLPSKPKKPQQVKKKENKNVPLPVKEKTVKGNVMKKKANSRQLSKMSKTRLQGSKNRKKPSVKSGTLKKKSKNAATAQAKAKTNVKAGELKGKANKPKSPPAQNKSKANQTKEKDGMTKGVTEGIAKTTTAKVNVDQSSGSTSELDLTTCHTNSTAGVSDKQAKQELQRRKAANAQRLRLKMMENKRVFAEMRKLQQGDPLFTKVYNSSPFG